MIKKFTDVGTEIRIFTRSGTSRLGVEKESEGIGKRLRLYEMFYMSYARIDVLQMAVSRERIAQGLEPKIAAMMRKVCWNR